MKKLVRSTYWKTFVAVLLLFLMLPFNSFSQHREKLKKEIEKIIKMDPGVDMEQVPAYVIGIIHRDSTYILSYGSTQKEVQKTPDEHTAFELGGLTKVFTANLAELLATEGSIHFDSSFNHYLPPGYRNPHLASLTLADLIAHTTGLPKMPLEFGIHQTELDNPYRHYTKKNLLEFYRNYAPAPSTEKPIYNYSHVNYALLEIAIEQATRQPFEKLMREKLFRELDFQNSFIYQRDSIELVQGHSLGGQATKPWQFQSFAASEGMKSSVGDLLHFVRQNMSEEAGSLSPILIKTHEKMTVTDYSKRVFAAKGWHVVERKRFPNTIAHTGSTTGYRSFMAFIPETKSAVILLTNSGQATGGLGYLILRMINNNWKKRKS